MNYIKEMNRLLLLFSLLSVSSAFGQKKPDSTWIKKVAQSEFELFIKVDSLLLNINSIETFSLKEDDVDFLVKEAVLRKNQRSILDLFRCDIGRIGESIKIEKNRNKDKDSITNQLKPMQRIHHVKPNYCSTTSLLINGLHSASEIAKVSDEEFVEKNRKNKSTKEVGLLIVFKYWLNWRVLRLKE